MIGAVPVFKKYNLIYMPIFIRSLFVMLLLFCCGIDLHAQAPKNFTRDEVKFIEEISSFLEATNKKEAVKLMERFEIPWTTGTLNSSQKELIYQTCDAMLGKRLKAFPDFSNYLNALIGFSESTQSAESFTNWHTGINKFLKGSTRRFSNYLVVCYDLFSSNTLYSSPSTIWRSSNNNYSFGFDSLPKIVFSGIDLTCLAKRDSSVIYNTSGTYYPSLKRFKGTGGKVYWERAALSSSEVYAELANYSIDISGSDYIADSVRFHNSSLFSAPLLGRLSEKILANIKADNASYPRFISYDVNLKIEKLISEAAYEGGFSMQGAKIIGSGNAKQKAKLKFYKNNKLFLEAAAQSFVIRPERIVSQSTSVTFYLDDDSIYHPSVEFKYIVKDKELSLIRPSGKSSGTPYYSSYHEVDMFFDLLTWKVEELELDMKMLSGASQVKLIFESTNYYRDQRYQKLQGISDTNPLYKLKDYGERYNTRVITVQEYSQHLKTNVDQIRGLFQWLNTQGFIAYDPSTEIAVLKDRLYYYLSASVGKTDYDILEFGSQISAVSNATMDLTSYNINMRGVPRVMLSDTQFVYVVPNEQELTLKKNRDFHFDGRLRAGRFDFRGTGFSFSYDDFNIKMTSIDSISIGVPSDTPDEAGKYRLIKLSSVLQNLSGTVRIELPDNKSSRKKNPAFPLFTSDVESYVYYDYPFIFDSVYNRNTFYFEIDPFTMDSLDNFVPESMEYGGRLVSAGIFPNIDESLKIQSDYSLGFKRQLDDQGLVAYGGKGKYYDKLTLSNAGLRGGGKIEYLSSVSLSKDFIFFPDSTNADVHDFTIARTVLNNVEYPQVAGRDVFINWRPKDDKMFAYKKTNDFDMYVGQTLLDGNLILANTGLSGNGNAKFEEAQLLSQDFRFKQITFAADTADFKLASQEAGLLALETTNMNSFIDLENRFGEFKSNGDGSYVTFPLNQYICFIENFKWNMDEKDVQFGAPTAEGQVAGGMNISGSEFISINPSQDSLRWFSPYANYNLVDYKINAHEVNEILVADASVIPGDGELVIDKNAKMNTLHQAKVIANIATRYHTMINASVNVLGRKNYNGNGDYEYIDQLQVKHLLRLTNIGVDTSYQTFAKGEVPDSLNFLLSPNIQYKGTFSIMAARQNPFFTGFARANHDCGDLISRNWFSFSSEIDPKGVSIPIVNPVNESRAPLTSAIVFDKDSANVYATFLSVKHRASDTEILSAEGLLSFDPSERIFKIAPSDQPIVKKDKKGNEELPFNYGNSFALDDKRCTFKGNGNMNLGANFGQFGLKTIGDIEFNPSNGNTTFDVMLDLDFFFNDEALKAMADLIMSYPTLPPTNDNRPVYQEGMRVLLGKEDAEKFISELSLFGLAKKVPSELQHSIFLSDVKMNWNRESLSFRSEGLIGVGLVAKNNVNRMVKGYVEIARKRSGDVFNFFFELDGITWFYFNYSRGVMQAVSSEGKFNDLINNMKPDKRVAPTKGGKAPYQFLLSTDRKKNQFLSRFRGEGLDPEFNEE